MKLVGIAVAVAITIVVAPLGAPLIHAAGGASLAFSSPAEGALVTDTLEGSLLYAGHSAGARNVSGQIQLDGEPVAAFTRGVGEPIPLALDLRALPRGAHALDAFAYTERDAPVSAPTRTFFLNHAPALGANASYADDVLRLAIEAADDADGIAITYATPLGNGTTPAGPAAIEIPGYLKPGNHSALVVATDADGAQARATASFVVANRPGSIFVTRAEYRGDGVALLEGVAADPDGVRTLAIHSGSGVFGVFVAPGGAFSTEVQVGRSLDGRDVTLVLADAYGGQTTTIAHVDMRPRHVVVYENDIRGIGADAGFETPNIPWIANGTITICVDVGCRMDATVLASSTVAVTWGAVGPESGNRTCVAAWRSAVCHFSTPSTTLDVVWTRASPSPLSIRVEGWTID